MNDVKLIGNLGKDAQVRTVPNGKIVVALSLATKRMIGRKGEENRKEETSWHQVECWGKLAERCRGLKKGQRLFVSGSYIEQQWKDKKTGENRRKHYCLASIVSALMNPELASGTASYGNDDYSDGYLNNSYVEGTF